MEEAQILKCLVLFLLNVHFEADHAKLCEMAQGIYKTMIFKKIV